MGFNSYCRKLLGAVLTGWRDSHTGSLPQSLLWRWQSQCGDLCFGPWLGVRLAFGSELVWVRLSYTATPLLVFPLDQISTGALLYWSFRSSNDCNMFFSQPNCISLPYCYCEKFMNRGTSWTSLTVCYWVHFFLSFLSFFSCWQNCSSAKHIYIQFSMYTYSMLISCLLITVFLTMK